MSEITRRSLLGMIGTAAGSTAMYYAMTSMGHAMPSDYTGPIQLEGAPEGTKVLILGAGLAGLTAALEMRAAGYEVEVLEFREKAGGRNWTLRSGDTYTELGGATQTVDFAEGNYINPGPWRLPHHHYAVMDYCRRLKVPLEPFVQTNYNAYVQRSDAYGGKPQRMRDIKTDYRGHVSELLAKAVDQRKIAPSICFETTVPQYVRNQVNRLAAVGDEPDILVNLTNDGWFYGTSCLDFHLACNVFRAVEMRKPLLVCANTGLSASIDETGRILKRGPRRDTDLIRAEVSTVDRFSPYRVVGDTVPILFAVLTILSALGGVVQGRRLGGCEK